MRGVSADLRAANILYQRGKHSDAAELLREVLEQDRQQPDALHLLGLCRHAQGDSAEGLELIRSAIALNPNEPLLHTHAGVLAVALGETKKGVANYHRAIELDPKFPDAYNNLGVALQTLGYLEDAAAVLRRAIALRPDGASALVNLGNALLAMGQPEDAAEQYRRAIEIAPDVPEAHNNLGNALRAVRSYDEAIESFDRALALRPDYAEALCGRALVLANRGDVEGARESIERAVAICPDPRFRLVESGLLPAMPFSRADMEQWRERFVKRISALLAEDFRMPGVPVDTSIMSFYLAYYGENDRDVMMMLSRLHRQAYPCVEWTAPHCAIQTAKVPGRRLRLGLYSNYLRTHAVAWTVHGLLEALPKDKFEIILFTLPLRAGFSIMPEIRAVADRIVTLPRSLERARVAIAESELDVLIFADIGMEPLSYSLAHARLAPVQCATWGHPVTTGISTIDYYISSDGAEPEDAQSHYSERLVRLGGIQTCYRRPRFPPSGDSPLAKYLPAGGTSYLCAQSLFKICPDMDHSLREILRRDPAGVLLCFNWMDELMTERLRRRWSGTFEGLMDRVRFLPRVPVDRFLAIVAAADVLLDTWPFGGGNTSYQGFAAGVPIVTLPGKYLRGRGTLALYRHMDITDCIADSPESYVDIAVRLGTEPDFRRRVSDLIRQRCHVLFDDERVGRDFARFLLDVTA